MNEFLDVLLDLIHIFVLRDLLAHLLQILEEVDELEELGDALVQDSF